MTTDLYGTKEQNGIRDRGFTPETWQKYLSTIDGAVDWTDKNLARVTCLRLLSDPGYPAWDVSYCHGELIDGTPVDVLLPFDQLPKKGLSRAIVEYAKKDGVYARGLGILSNISTLC